MDTLVPYKKLTCVRLLSNWLETHLATMFTKILVL